MLTIINAKTFGLKCFKKVAAIGTFGRSVYFRGNAGQGYFHLSGCHPDAHYFFSAPNFCTNMSIV